MIRVVKKYLKRVSKRLRKQKRWLVLAVLPAVIVTSGFMIERSYMNADYTDLLNTIAEGESRGNYNAYFGKANNRTIKFTEMPVGEVLAWQKEYVASGSPSSAVGRYQFIDSTLRGLIQEMNIDINAPFDEALQDRLAVRLLERRGVREYLRGKITREELAHNLSKEWAALPRVLGDNPTASYYAGDGLNRAQISVGSLLAVIDNLLTRS